MPTFYIWGPEAGDRLDRYLTEKLPTLSRNQIQKLIDRGRITVNGRGAKPHTALRKKDHVEVSLNEERTAPVRVSEPPPVRVIAEDLNFLVINKPANLLVHSVPGRNGPTLADWLKAHDPTIAAVGESSERPGVVHRLDEDVSGVMVIAKTQGAFEHLKNQFSNRTVEKEYLALVHGTLPKPDGIVDFPIARSRQHGRKMAARSHSQADGARDAITRYETVETFQHYTLLRVKPETGRTNQIRVHLNAINHPIVGDPLYRPRHFRATKTPGRMFLQAVKLTFHDLAGQKRTYEAPSDPTLSAFLDTLRRGGRASEPEAGHPPTRPADATARPVDRRETKPYDDLALYEFTDHSSYQPPETSDRPADDETGNDRPRPPEAERGREGTHSNL